MLQSKREKMAQAKAEQLGQSDEYDYEYE